MLQGEDIPLAFQAYVSAQSQLSSLALIVAKYVQIFDEETCEIPETRFEAIERHGIEQGFRMRALCQGVHVKGCKIWFCRREFIKAVFFSYQRSRLFSLHSLCRARTKTIETTGHLETRDDELIAIRHEGEQKRVSKRRETRRNAKRGSRQMNDGERQEDCDSKRENEKERTESRQCERVRFRSKERKAKST